MDTHIREPKKGAVRYLDKVDGQHHVVEPGNAHYTDALMIAQEYWSSDRKAWVEISQKNA